MVEARGAGPRRRGPRDGGGGGGGGGAENGSVVLDPSSPSCASFSLFDASGISLFSTKREAAKASAVGKPGAEVGNGAYHGGKGETRRDGGGGAVAVVVAVTDAPCGKDEESDAGDEDTGGTPVVVVVPDILRVLGPPCVDGTVDKESSEDRTRLVDAKYAYVPGRTSSKG